MNQQSPSQVTLAQLAAHKQQMLNQMLNQQMLGGNPNSLANALGAGQLGLQQQQTQQQSQVVAGGKIHLVIGDSYFLQDFGSWIGLRHKGSWIHLWPIMSPPNRSSLAAAIKEDRSRRLLVNTRDPLDGSILGIRLFGLAEDYHLQSPSQKTVWEDGVLSTAEWNESDAIRGVAGIHAAWRPISLRCKPNIDTVDTTTGVIALVRGMGKFVAGKEGWRAERVIIDEVFLPIEIYSRWRIVSRLAKLYPDVSFKEEPWTLERSSRSVR